MQDVRIELASDISILSVQNNSAKTFATQGIQMFVAASKDSFSLYDFSSSTWKKFDELETCLRRCRGSRDPLHQARSLV